METEEYLWCVLQVQVKRVRVGDCDNGVVRKTAGYTDVTTTVWTSARLINSLPV